jgi:hypothetical protein
VWTSDQSWACFDWVVDDARHPSLDDRFDPAVRIVEYDPAWPGMAEAEIARIAAAVADAAVRIDHVGSTSVPGLAAKPIVDLQLAVADVDARSLYVGPLEGLGYLFAPDPASPDFHFFGLPVARPRTHHLHVCAAGSGAAADAPPSRLRGGERGRAPLPRGTRLPPRPSRRGQRLRRTEAGARRPRPR